MNELYDAYHKYFEIVMADSPELKKETYRIRYQVLCLEDRIPGFEPSNYPDGLEKDIYDSHSVHALLKHRPTGKFIGTVRIILLNTKESDKSCPLESYANISEVFFSKKGIFREKTVEISRFIVIGEFQRRKGERNYNEAKEKSRHAPGKGFNEKKDRRSSSNITLVLMAAVMQMSVQHKIDNWLSFMTPGLHRLLSYYGITATPIGPLIDCHGLRQPYHANVSEIIIKTYNEYLNVWELLTDKGKWLPTDIHLD